MKRKYLKSIMFQLCCVLMACSVVSCAKTDGADTDDALPQLPKGHSDYQKEIKKAYQFKKTGHNQKALAHFEKAFKMIEPQSIIYASALDDQASVLMRLGKTDEARKRFQKAIKILKENNGNPRLRTGVEGRLETLDQLVKQNIKCNEPGEPDANAALPYFPNVVSVQHALGSLTRRVAKCKDSNVIEPISMRMIFSGDGKLIRAYAKDQFADTPTEKCVVKKIRELLPETDLPKFGACFRGFTYPFMIGNHPERKEPDDADEAKTDAETESDAEADDGTIPKENAVKGEMPSVENSKEKFQKLVDAYANDTTEDAMSLFFPAEAFDVVKDSPNPGRYYKQLVQWYKEDIALEASRFKGEPWKVDSIDLGTCKWKEPGSESNKVAYWSCTRNMVTVTSGEKQRRFEIRVLINWGDRWYITHLRPIRQ